MNLYVGSQPDSYSLAMRRGKESECEGITIGNEEVIGKIDDDGCKTKYFKFVR